MSHKLYVFLSFVVLVSMLLPACQSQPGEKVEVTKIVAGTPIIQQIVVTATPAPPTVAQPTAAQPTAVLKPADTIVIAMQQEPDTLHPLISSMTASTKVRSAILMGCMLQNDKAEWVPLGCETIPTVDNGNAKLVGEGADRHLEVTYKIRRGWRWTDGTPVTSKDVIYAWKLQMDPDLEQPARTSIEKLYEIVAVDDSTFVARFMSEKQARAAAAGTLKGAVPFEKFKADYVDSGYGEQVGPVVDPTYWNVGWAAGSWLPEHILAKIPAKDHKSSDYARKPVGDGPYVLKEWKASQEIVLEKSDKPFPLGEPKIKTVVFRFFAETAAVISALQKGEVDAVTTSTGGLTTNNAPDLDKIEAAGKFKIIYQPGYSWEHLDFNVTKFPMDDVKVRQALYYAIDKKTLVDKLYFGRQQTTDLPLPKISWAYTDNYSRYPYDLNKAKALLKEAGWDCAARPCTKKVMDGGKEVTKKLEFVLMTTDRSDRVDLAQVIQQQWFKVNVGVQVQYLYGRQLFNSCSTGGPLYCRTYDAAIFTTSTGDDATFIGSDNCAAIPTKENNWTGQNRYGFCSKAADEALNKSENDVEVALSPQRRKPYIEKFLQVWTAEVPSIPLFANSSVGAQRVGLKNWRPGPTQFAPETWNCWEWELSK